MSPNQQWKMEDLLTKFNLTLKNFIIKYAINILKTSLRNNINLVSNIKDKLKHSVIGAQEQNITDDIFKQGLEDIKKKLVQKICLFSFSKKITQRVILLEKATLFQIFRSILHWSSSSSDIRHHTSDTRHHTLDTRHLSRTLVTYLGHIRL